MSRWRTRSLQRPCKARGHPRCYAGYELNMQSLEESKNNYLVCIAYTPTKIGFSAADVTTGDYYLTELEDLKKLGDELMKYEPSEIICNDAFLVSGMKLEDLRARLHAAINPLDAHFFDDESCKRLLQKHFKVSTLIGLGIEDFPVGLVAAGALLAYLYDTQKNDLGQLRHLYPYLTNKFMLLDSSTRRNLELTETLREKQKRGSLLWVLDKTKTAMGARMLRGWIEQPLIEKAAMEERLDALEELKENSAPGMRSGSILNRCMTFGGFQSKELSSCREEIDGLEDIYQLILQSITEEPPITIREGGILRDGFDENVDKLRSAKRDGKQWLAQLEEEDRARTGIKGLKIKYNKVFGYYFEVTNSYANLVPEDYIRKQTLANAERYTTPRLKELEDTILNAEEKLQTLEYDIFCEIRDSIAQEIERIQKTAKAIARLDVFCSLSLVAERNRYVRPKLNEKGVIDIKDGRHPVVEQMIDKDLFIANDTFLDNGKKHMIHHHRPRIWQENPPICARQPLLY